jgi:type II secretory pathway component GspD/PulD (secretin)
VKDNKILKAGSMVVLFAMLILSSGQGKIFAQGAGGQQAQPSGNQQQGQAGNQPATQPAGGAQANAKGEEIKKALAEPVPVLEIKRLESESPLYSIELRDVRLTDLFRVIAHDYNLNILMDQTVSGTITASFTNISLDEALNAIADMSNLTIEKKGSIVKVSPNLVTKTFILKYIEARKLYQDAVTAQAATSGQAQSAGGATGLFGLLSEKGKILVGTPQNSLTVIDYPDRVAKVEDFIKVIDHKLETKVFKLKYLKADEVVGATVKTTTVTQATTPTGTQVSTTTSSSTASGTTTVAK